MSNQHLETSLSRATEHLAVLLLLLLLLLFLNPSSTFDRSAIFCATLNDILIPWQPPFMLLQNNFFRVALKYKRKIIEPKIKGIYSKYE